MIDCKNSFGIAQVVDGVDMTMSLSVDVGIIRLSWRQDHDAVMLHMLILLNRA